MRRPLLPLILLGIGVVMVLLAIGAGIRTALFLRKAAHATATISDQSLVSQPVTGRRDQVTYRPTFTFQTADGHWVAVTSSVSSNSAHTSGSRTVNTTPHVHDQVPVVYDPADPTHATIDSFFHVWIVAFVFGVLGIAFTGFGLVFISLSR